MQTFNDIQAVKAYLQAQARLVERPSPRVAPAALGLLICFGAICAGGLGACAIGCMARGAAAGPGQGVALVLAAALVLAGIVGLFFLGR